jgi:hypothetical protein
MLNECLQRTEMKGFMCAFGATKTRRVTALIKVNV